MTPARISEILREGVTARTGRADIAFEYDPQLMSDLASDLIAFRVSPEDEEGEAHVVADDGRKHGVSLDATIDRLITQCGTVVQDSWEQHRGGMWFWPG